MFTAIPKCPFLPIEIVNLSASYGAANSRFFMAEVG
jgi:hypothetical protein